MVRMNFRLRSTSAAVKGQYRPLRQTAEVTPRQLAAAKQDADRRLS
jgi:hypothetical protein